MFVISTGSLVVMSYVWHIVYLSYKELKYKCIITMDDNIGSANSKIDGSQIKIIADSEQDI